MYSEKYRVEYSIMRFAKIILSVFAVCAAAEQTPSQTRVRGPAEGKRLVIAASAVLDGKGRVLRNTRIVIEGHSIDGWVAVSASVRLR
jgi:hypothetical protein